MEPVPGANLCSVKNGLREQSWALVRLEFIRQRQPDRRYIVHFQGNPIDISDRLPLSARLGAHARGPVAVGSRPQPDCFEHCHMPPRQCNCTAADRKKMIA
jgi:hypothetical protein